jgi:Mg2+-importing ATPase
MPNPSKSDSWWLEPLPSDAAAPAALAAGLSTAEATARLAKYGLNLFRERRDKSLLLQYLTRFRNPLVLILLVASTLSAFTGEVANFLIITASCS